MIKYFLYARKSTDEPDRQILSIEAQITELKEFAERENLNVVENFIESQTAKIPGRPIFNEMIKRIESGEAEGILAWHPLCQHQHLILVLIVLFNLFPDESNIPV